jgi:hypothetical protein
MARWEMVQIDGDPMRVYLERTERLAAEPGVSLSQ